MKRALFRLRRSYRKARLDPTTGDLIAVFALSYDPANGADRLNLVAYEGFNGPVNVPAGDVNGDGLAALVTSANPRRPTHVKAFSGLDGSLIDNFFAFDAAYTGGVTDLQCL